MQVSSEAAKKRKGGHFPPMSPHQAMENHHFRWISWPKGALTHNWSSHYQRKLIIKPSPMGDQRKRKSRNAPVAPPPSRATRTSTAVQRLPPPLTATLQRTNGLPTNPVNDEFDTNQHPGHQTQNRYQTPSPQAIPNSQTKAAVAELEAVAQDSNLIWKWTNLKWQAKVQARKQIWPVMKYPFTKATASMNNRIQELIQDELRLEPLEMQMQWPKLMTVIKDTMRGKRADTVRNMKIKFLGEAANRRNDSPASGQMN